MLELVCLAHRDRAVERRRSPARSSWSRGACAPLHPRATRARHSSSLHGVAEDHLATSTSALRDSHWPDDPRRGALLDAPPVEAFQRLAQLGRRVVDARAVVVSLCGADGECFTVAASAEEAWASRYEGAGPRALSRLVATSAAPLVLDSSGARPPADVAGPEPVLAAYAGFPLVASTGMPLGTFCVFDSRPRVWTADELDAVRTLAAAAAAESELRIGSAVAVDPAGARDRAMDEIPDALLVLDTAWQVVNANSHAEAMLGVRRDALLGRKLWQILPSSMESEFGRCCIRAFVERRAGASETAIPGVDGWFDVHAVPAADGRLSLYLRDATARHAAAAARQAADERVRMLVDSVGEVVFESDAAGRWTALSPAWAILTGHPVEETLGRPVLDFVHPDDRPGALAAMAPLLARRIPAWHHEVRYLTRDRSVRRIAVRARTAFDDAGGVAGSFGTLNDITDEPHLVGRPASVAHYDPLTGVANERRFTDRLVHAATRAARGERAAVLLVDLDDFTAVNDALGRDAGDQMLRIVADRLLGATREIDTVARLGADDFAVLIEGIERDEEIAVVAGRILLGLAASCEIGGRTMRISASLGAATVESGIEVDGVLRNADIALYRAKTGGKGRMERFTPALREAARDQSTLAGDLRLAFKHGQFELVYQPIVDLRTGAPVGVETLMRWRHPERGAVSPATFIPVAEEIGLIVPLGEWALTEACRAIAALPIAASGPAGGLYVSVNVSGLQLQEYDFVDQVAGALAATGLAPQRLLLEITETALVRDLRRARRVLGELRAMSVRVAIDDFGVGYSALSYLQQLPLDVLKIDRSFIEQFAQAGGQSLAFARTMVALAEALGLRTVAEGIELREQRDALLALGCELGQGYLFARPLAMPDLVAWLADHPGSGAGVPTDAGAPA